HYRWGAIGRDDLRLNARFEKFALTHFPLLDARVSGNLDLTGSLAALNATGDLDFDHVQVNLPAREDPLFREVRILGLEKGDAVATAPLQSPRPSAYQSAQAEIAIDVRRGARIRQRGADLQVEGKFRLRKKRMSPTLLQGSLRTTYGTYTFLGRRFDVSEAIATFNERNPPDPDVHLVATRQFGDVTVGVETSGRWSEPESRLISTPEMDDSEILSYLVFDKPIDEIGQRNDNRLNAAVAQMAGNMALSQLSRALSEELPINEISMGVNEDMTVATIGVETSVGDDIIVRYDRALQAGTGDRVTVEWRFWKNFSLRSEYANGDTSGLDVFWSYEY
ncbi:MAG: translocation/assembly module TamB, partial [Deltaproteobacteria bacterium]|nr:translocation/assembly module TamB [Deltaproteobacteria bacterium]